ncbi:MAG: alpha/beta fold hydrolase, partial [Candidatus Eisenbacteria bacterium]
MLRIRVLIATLLAIAAPVTAQVQQLPDSAFHATVAAPAFTIRHPKILFDEAHHNFHTLDGRYQAFGELMRADGCTTTPNRELFSAKLLKGYDVLVIANALGAAPTGSNDSLVTRSAFSPEEIEVVHSWVREGGALLFIADHAPFGSAAAAMSQRFDVDMSLGYTGDTLQAQDPKSATNILFTLDRGTLGDHPIMAGRDEKERIGKVVAFTGQSLLGPAGSTPIMILSEGAFDLPLAALKLSEDPQAMMAKSIPAKGRSMAVALQVEKGRALIQGEAGMLSAQVILRDGAEPMKFGMNQPGLDNQQYALNAVRWLAGEKRPAHNLLNVPAITGTWEGKLAGRIRFIVHLSRDDAGGWRASADSPDQNAMGLTVDAVTVEGDSLRFTMRQLGGDYGGRINAARTEIDGTWKQGGAAIPLLLRPQKAGSESPRGSNRPQEPKPPFPYDVILVSYPNPNAKGVTLAGTLTVPRGSGPAPCAVLITGSGPEDRDETIFGHKPFLILADYLTRHGIAVLRSDDRGVGKSTGSAENATSDDFAGDVAAAVKFLKTRKEIDPTKIGLIGHSEGGLIAPMVAMRDKSVAFVVLLAGPGVPGDSILIMQSRLISIS